MFRSLLRAAAVTLAIAAPAGAEAPLDVANPLPDAAAPGAARTAEPAADGKYEIDVLVVYTPLYAERMGSADAQAQALTDQANVFFDNSLMPIRYRLAGTAPSRGTSETSDYFENQIALAKDGGVRSLRNRFGADLVVLFRTNDDPSRFCGLSVGFNNGEQSDPPQNVNPERDAFIVVGAAPDAAGVGCGDIARLYAHELGHALGGGHQYIPGGVTIGSEPPVKPYGPYWKTYAHAWTCGDAGGGEPYYSIMYGGLRAGANGQYVTLAGEPRGDFYSNPALLLDGQVCGQDGVPGSEATEANNARAMTEAAPFVAAYRSGKAKGSTGTLGGAFAPPMVLMLLLAAALSGCSPRSDTAAGLKAGSFPVEKEFSCEGYPRSAPQGVTICELRRFRDLPTGRNVRIEVDVGDVQAIGEPASRINMNAYVYATGVTEERARETAAQVEIHTTGDHFYATGPMTTLEPVEGVSASGPEGWSISFDVRLPEALNLSASAGSGEVIIALLDGSIAAAIGNGNILLGTLSGTVTASASNGGVQMYLGGTSWAGSGATLDVGTGPVTFWAPQNYSAIFDVTTANGTIHSDFGGTPEPQGAGAHLTETAGQGGKTLKATTGSGDIGINVWTP